VATAGNGNVIIQITGSRNRVSAGMPYLELTRYQQRRASRWEPGSEGVATLLSPYARILPMIGRNRQHAELWEWMRGPLRVAVRVMTGTTGTGKTRLALELCDAAVAEGWDAGFLTHREIQRFVTQQNPAAWGWARPTLAVIDYAAAVARQIRGWLVDLADNAVGTSPLRVLLLERQADLATGWCQEAFGVGGGDSDVVRGLLDPAKCVHILPLIGRTEDRKAIFKAVLTRIGEPRQVQEVIERPGFERRLDQPWAGEPLLLLMAACEAAQTTVDQALSLSRTDLGLRMAGHEMGRIEAIAQGRGVPGKLLAHLAAYATLCGGLPRSERQAVVAEERRELGFDTGSALADINAALSVAFVHESGSLAAITPSLLGGAVVLQALAMGDAEAQEAAVVRAAARFPKPVAAWLMRLVQDYGTVSDVPLALLRGLTKTYWHDLVALSFLLGLLPERTVSLREFAFELSERVVELARQHGRTELLPAYLMLQAMRLGDLGNLAGALEASQEGVARLRENVAQGKKSGLLVMALHQYSVHLGRIGRFQEAAEALQESITLHGPALLGADASVVTTALLTSLSSQLHRRGLSVEALAVSRMEVALERKLAAESPDVDRRSALAGSLNDLVNRLAASGFGEEALTVSDEQVAISREVAASRPDEDQQILALALHTSTMCRIRLARWDEARAVGQEGLTALRRLHALLPEAFSKMLAHHLGHLAIIDANFGRHDSALAYSEEATAILSALAARHPGAALPGLPNSLQTHALNLSALGHGEEAARAFRDLADAWRAGELSPRDAEQWRALGYGTYLQSLQAAEPAERCRLIEEALEACRATVRLQPENGDARNLLGLILCEAAKIVGEPVYGRERLDEAAKVLRPSAISVDDAGRFARLALVSCLIRRSELEEERAHREEIALDALAVARDAVETDPEGSQAWFFLGASLGLVARLHGDPGCGSPLGEEAVGAYQRAVELDRKNTRAWHNLGWRLGQAARATGVRPDLGLLDEAIAAYREVTEQTPDEFAGWLNLGSALRERSECATVPSETTFSEEAMAATRRAVALAPNNGRCWYSLGIGLDAVAAHTLSAAALDAIRGEALDAYRRALALDPSHLEPLERLCRHGERLTSESAVGAADLCAAIPQAFETSLAAAPASTAWYDVAVAVHRLTLALPVGALIERLRELEIAAYRAFLAARPESSAGWVNLGISLWEQAERHTEATGAVVERVEAMACFRRSVDANPHEVKGMRLLARSLATSSIEAADPIEASSLREEARASLRRAMASEPANVELLMYAAQLLIGMAMPVRGTPLGRQLTAEALGTLRDAVSAAPDHPGARYELGMQAAYASEYERDPESVALLDESIGSLRIAAHLDRAPAVVWYNLGVALWRRFLHTASLPEWHWLNEAVEALQRTVRDDPTNAQAWEQLGRAQAHQVAGLDSAAARRRQADEAIASWRRAVEVDLGRDGVWSELAVALEERAIELSDKVQRGVAWQEALAAYRRAAAGPRNEARWRFAVALLWRATQEDVASTRHGFIEEAFAVIERAKTEGSDSLGSLNLRGVCLHLLSRLDADPVRRVELLDEAIDAFEAATAQDAAEGPAWRNLASVLVTRWEMAGGVTPAEDLDRAVAALRRATAIQPEAWFELGIHLGKAAAGLGIGEERERMHEEQLAAFRQATERQPQHGHSWLMLGSRTLELECLGTSPTSKQQVRGIEALAALRRGRELLQEADIAPLRLQLSRIYRKAYRITGDDAALAEALALARAVLEGDGTGRYEVAAALVLAGQIEQAAEELGAALEAGEVTLAQVQADPEWERFLSEHSVQGLLARGPDGHDDHDGQGGGDGGDGGSV
jgi:tetratricopeptide (TPR) repeat protein